MNIPLKSGMVAYANNLSIHFSSGQIKYTAPRDMKFAVIVMLAEVPSEDGIKADDFLKSCGWVLKEEDSVNISDAATDRLRVLIGSEIADFFAGFGGLGEPETPEQMQAQLIARIYSVLAQ